MAKTLPQPLLLKYDEAASILAVSKSKLYRMVIAGEIPAVRFGGNIRIRMSDLEQVVERTESPKGQDRGRLGRTAGQVPRPDRSNVGAQPADGASPGRAIRVVRERRLND